jgi:cytochrome P450
MTRQAVADDTVGGYRIPAKALVVVSPYVTQRHPKFWENPDRFDPLPAQHIRHCASMEAGA